MAKTKILLKDEGRKAFLQKLYESPGWKIYEEEVLKAALDAVEAQFNELTSVSVSETDRHKLNNLISQKAFLKGLMALSEPLKEEAESKSLAEA